MLITKTAANKRGMWQTRALMAVPVRLLGKAVGSSFGGATTPPHMVHRRREKRDHGREGHRIGSSSRCGACSMGLLLFLVLPRSRLFLILGFRGVLGLGRVFLHLRFLLFLGQFK